MSSASILAVHWLAGNERINVRKAWREDKGDLQPHHWLSPASEAFTQSRSRVAVGICGIGEGHPEASIVISCTCLYQQLDSYTRGSGAPCCMPNLLLMFAIDCYSSGADAMNWRRLTHAPGSMKQVAKHLYQTNYWQPTITAAIYQLGPFLLGWDIRGCDIGLVRWWLAPVSLGRPVWEGKELSLADCGCCKANRPIDRLCAADWRASLMRHRQTLGFTFSIFLFLLPAFSLFLNLLNGGLNGHFLSVHPHYSLGIRSVFTMCSHLSSYFTYCHEYNWYNWHWHKQPLQKAMSTIVRSLAWPLLVLRVPDCDICQQYWLWWHTLRKKVLHRTFFGAPDCRK